MLDLSVLGHARLPRAGSVLEEIQQGVVRQAGATEGAEFAAAGEKTAKSMSHLAIVGRAFEWQLGIQLLCDGACLGEPAAAHGVEAIPGRHLSQRRDPEQRQPTLRCQPEDQRQVSMRFT